MREITNEEIERAAMEALENLPDEGLFPNYSDKDIYWSGMVNGAIWMREQMKGSPQDIPATIEYTSRDSITVEDIRRITKEIEEKEKKILELEEIRFKTIVEGYINK